MKLPIIFITLFCLTLMAIPAMAGNVYDNGPVNGESDAWTINFGFAVTDSFTVSNGNGSIGGMGFWAWLIPGDSITSVGIQIGNAAFGNNLMDMTVGLSQSNCFVNNFGYNVCLESGAFNGPNLANGNYWVTLQNAMVPSGDPTYWDENSGIGCQSPGCPSLAEEYSGTITSEAFTLTAQGTTSTGTTPEPGSVVLFASAVVGVAATLRRKQF